MKVLVAIKEILEIFTPTGLVMTSLFPLIMYVSLINRSRANQYWDSEESQSRDRGYPKL